MKWIPVFFWLALSTFSILSGMGTVAAAEEASARWDGIQRLNVDLTAREAAPFLPLGNLPPETTKFDSTPHNSSHRVDPSEIQLVNYREASQEPVVHESPQQDPLTVHQKAEQKNVTSLAARSQDADPGTVHKIQMRESLAKAGQSSLESRDDLTSEVISVTKWTIVMLVVGGVTLVGLKKLGLKNAGLPSFGLKNFPSLASSRDAGNRIRVLETLHLGRQQGLKLVEVGQERFLIASDQTGIKSVTLLPNWPALDQEESLESPQPDLPVEPRIYTADESERMTG